YDDISISTGQAAGALVVTPPGSQTAVEGASNSFSLGSFSDSTSGANSWSVDVNWGDNTAHTTFSTSSQGSLGTSGHTFGEEGTVHGHANRQPRKRSADHGQRHGYRDRDGERPDQLREFRNGRFQPDRHSCRRRHRDQPGAGWPVLPAIAA